MLDKTSVIYTIALRPINEDAFKIIGIDHTQRDELIDISYYKKILNEDIGKIEEAIYDPSTRGFYILEYAGDGCSDENSMWKNRMHSIGTAFPYIWCGAPWLALDVMDGENLSLSESQLLCRILPESMRYNLLAEAEYGNCHRHRHLAFLTSNFLNLLPDDPKKIYNTPNSQFYIHPAGMNHDGRYKSIKYMNVGQTVTLEPEATNSYDPNAVHIYTDYGADIAYVPRQIASTVAFSMRRGAKYAGAIAAIISEEQNADDAISIRIILENG